MSADLPPVAILAGGLATRLRPLTATLPKALVEVAGEPFVHHQLRLLRERGARRVVLCVGHLGGMIAEQVGDGRRFGLEVRYSDDGPRLLGTAGAIRQALPLLGETFLVLYGDSYLPCDYRAVQDAFARSRRAALMTVFRTDDRWARSNVEFDGTRILAYDKEHPTPRMRHIDYGLGAFRATAFDSLEPGEPGDLAALYQDLLRVGEVAAHEVGERFYEIGSPAGLAKLRAHLAAPTGSGR
jgi:NDP-sugar pyrophosphorylase family protein